MRKMLILLICYPMFAWSYSIVLLTDQKPAVKAQEIKEVFKTLYPFNQFNLNLKIVMADKNTLDCKSSPTIERLILCNYFEIAKIKFQHRANQIITIADLPIYGGSGGMFPVTTTNSPKEVAVHELLHNFDFSDEYEYSNSEADFYCARKIKAPNTVYLKNSDLDLESNYQAVKKFRRHLPWKKYVSKKTVITHEDGRELGTGPIKDCEKYNYSDTPRPIDVALYQGITCNSATKPYTVWHPGAKKTIMRDLNCGLGGYYEEVVTKILDKKKADPKVTD